MWKLHLVLFWCSVFCTNIIQHINDIDDANIACLASFPMLIVCWFCCIVCLHCVPISATSLRCTTPPVVPEWNTGTGTLVHGYFLCEGLVFKYKFSNLNLPSLNSHLDPLIGPTSCIQLPLWLSASLCSDELCDEQLSQEPTFSLSLCLSLFFFF